jgi:hypothetical protein|tara:strand:- start:121 stop:339 length:219 start_codon:yes stop_codon:yes gene_type:complete
MSKKSNKIGIELDDFHYHEALDRLHVIMDTIDNHLIQHSVLKLETEVKELVDEAQNKLWEAYQIIGNIKTHR